MWYLTPVTEQSVLPECAQPQTTNSHGSVGIGRQDRVFTKAEL